MSPKLQKSGITPSLARKRKRYRQLAREAGIKGQVRIREAHICRVCFRRLESVHEIQPKSVGGVVSLENSIGVCGDGVRGCHGFLQRHEIDVLPGEPKGVVNAEGPLVFHAKTRAAQTWVYGEYVIEDGVRFG